MSVPILYDMPISNAGARCRIVIYKKNLSLENDIVIKPPSDIGGLKSPEYLALNPQGKMPLLVTEDGAIPESDTICRYLLERFSSAQPSFIPTTLKARTKSDLLCRLHDIYVNSIQGCMYKAAPPFGAFTSRTAALAELKKQLAVLNDAADSEGPYLAGAEMSLADAALFGTLVFVEHCLPKFSPPGETYDSLSTLGPRLHKWYTWIKESDPVFTKVHGEISAVLQKWDQDGRWKTILHAGLRDTEARTIFDKIIQKQIPSEVVFEDDRTVAFKDVSPKAPVHLLIIPKHRDGLTQLRYATEDHEGLLGHMLAVAAKIAKEQNLGGYRLVINDGDEAGQSVFHLHMHLLSGRHLNWPPG